MLSEALRLQLRPVGAGVPNLQSELLLSSLAAFTASFAANDHRELREWRERWSTPEKAVARRDLVWRTLKQYDLLGTTDEFYESTLLVARTLNWSFADVAAPERACSSLISVRSSWSVALRRDSRVDVFILFLTAGRYLTPPRLACARRRHGSTRTVTQVQLAPSRGRRKGGRGQERQRAERAATEDNARPVGTDPYTEQEMCERAAVCAGFSHGHGQPVL